MEITDLFLAPVYLLIIYAIAFRIRKGSLKDRPEGKYFIPGLTLKLIGSVATGLIYFFYYKTGDTVFYYYRITIIHDLFLQEPSLALKIIFADVKEYNADIVGYFEVLRMFDTSAFMVTRIGSLLAIISFGSYTIISLFFAALSYTGIWKLYRTFTDIYPKLHKELAIAILFIPTVFFWGSGVFKDTISLTGLGWLTYAGYNFFIQKRKRKTMLVIMVISVYFVFVIKAYIIMSFVPALLFWIFFTYQSRIKSAFLRVLATPVIIGVSILLVVVFMNQMGAQNSYWSVAEIEDRAKDMQWWHTRVVELYGAEGGGGSHYQIGDGSFEIGNIIRSIPLSVSYSLFGPPIWRVSNPIMLLASIEGLIILFLTIRILFKTGIGRTLSISIRNPVIVFCLFFAIIFAFAVGFTSFNFGALVRYKIPCIPFFLSALYMIRHQANKDKNEEELELTE